MKLTGWGNNIDVNSYILYPRNNKEIIKILKDKKINRILCRGLGRSYGDNNLNSNVILLSNYKKKFSIDKKNKTLSCTANLSINEICDILIKKGFFFHVTPGSKMMFTVKIIILMDHFQIISRKSSLLLQTESLKHVH